MVVSDLLYRIGQKIKYHTSSNPLKKRIAEINRFHRVVTNQGDQFMIEGCALSFNTEAHSFVLQGMDLFNMLLRQPHLSFRIQDEDLVCQIDDLLIAITTSEELFILNEIWVEGCYNVILKTDKPVVVIDVGMNVGYASLFFASQRPIYKVYAFEPFKPTYEQGVANLNFNPHVAQKLETYNFGLSGVDTVLEVDYSPHHRGRSGIWGTELILENIEQKNREKVTLKSFNSTVKGIVEDHPDCDFLWKIDCEGSEYDIFENMNESLFENTRCILMEWHKKGSRYLAEKLSKKGFTILSMSPNSEKVGMLYAFK